MIDYGFTKLEGKGSVFMRNNNLLAYFPNNLSYYFGISLLNGTEDPTKIIDSLINPEYDDVKVSEHYAKFTSKGKKAEVYVGSDNIKIISEYDNFLDLDYRQIYDFGTEGRYYEVIEGKILIVECKQNEKTFYLAIKGKIELQKEWIKKHYSFDAGRNDTSEFYVFRLGKMLPGEITIGLGNTKEKAMHNLRKHITSHTFKNLDSLFDSRLKSLIGEEQLYAGFPWFFQYWSRDQLISINAYEKEFRKKILLLYKDSLLLDGRLPNRIPNSDLGSADSIGIYALRISQNLELFNKHEREELLKLLTTAKERLDKHYIQEQLIHSNNKETWMDTIPRAGFNIEIQAQYARILHTINQLGGTADQELFIKTVREKFVNIDNVTDKETRPNIFLAYYFFPKLFDDKVWLEKFQATLKECWLEWGGLSSVSTKSWLFHENHTGKTDESYHNGDSWYFVNNIAAIAMLNFDELKGYAEKIYDASMKEFYSQGLLGCAAEISDAKSMQSKGCMHQTWSLATLKELRELIK